MGQVHHARDTELDRAVSGPRGRFFRSALFPHNRCVSGIFSRFCRLLLAVVLLLPISNGWAAAADKYAFNGSNVDIPDAGGFVSSTIAITGAPAGAVVTGIDVYFRVVHPYSGDLNIDLNADAQVQLGNYDLWQREGGAQDNPSRTVTGISSFNGLSVNRTWYLYAKDEAPTDSGYIDEWSIRVYYTAVAPTPTVSNINPTAMTATGTSQALTITGSNFQSGNIVQFFWGVGAGAGVWNTGSTPTINSASQITGSMNPGTVNDTIYVRVCSTSGATACSSGTQTVTVTAVAPTPTVSNINPTAMTATGTSQALTITGSNFQSGNIVQFRWGVGAGAGVWNTSSSGPTINSASQITVSMNPGTVNDTIYVRVCSTSSGAACSSGTHAVTVQTPGTTPGGFLVLPFDEIADVEITQAWYYDDCTRHAPMGAIDYDAVAFGHTETFNVR